MANRPLHDPIMKDPEHNLCEEEYRHNNYSVEAAEKDYANRVYYQQRKGGENWFHGRVSKAYRAGYDQINWNK